MGQYLACRVEDGAKALPIECLKIERLGEIELYDNMHLQGI